MFMAYLYVLDSSYNTGYCIRRISLNTDESLINIYISFTLKFLMSTFLYKLYVFKHGTVVVKYRLL